MANITGNHVSHLNNTSHSVIGGLATRGGAREQGKLDEFQSRELSGASFSATMAELLNRQRNLLAAEEQGENADLYKHNSERRPEDMQLGGATKESAAQNTIADFSILQQRPNVAEWQKLNQGPSNADWQVLNGNNASESDWSVLETIGSGLLGAAKIAAAVFL